MRVVIIISRYSCVMGDGTWRYPSPSGRVLSEVSSTAVSRICRQKLDVYGF